MSDYMLDFSNDDLEDGQRLQAASDGEYRLRLKDWKMDEDGKIKLTSANGKPYIMPIFEIINCPEEDYTKDITHYIGLPDSESMTAKQVKNAKAIVREFWEALRVDYSRPIDPEELLGSEVDALLNVTDDPQYGERNNIVRFIVSH
jgi:hypothetical protein